MAICAKCQWVISMERAIVVYRTERLIVRRDQEQSQALKCKLKMLQITRSQHRHIHTHPCHALTLNPIASMFTKTLLTWLLNYCDLYLVLIAHCLKLCTQYYQNIFPHTELSSYYYSALQFLQFFGSTSVYILLDLSVSESKLCPSKISLSQLSLWSCL